MKEPSKAPLLIWVGLAAAAVLLAVFLLWFFAGSGDPEVTQVKAGNRGNSDAQFVCDRDPLLVLNGSEVLGQTLAPELVRAWLASNGVSELSNSRQGTANTISGRKSGRDCKVLIKGPNSEDGFTALRDGKADIAMSAHQMLPEQARALSGLGDMSLPAAEHVAAIDALAVIVHPSNRVDGLNRGELADILAGRLTRWDAVNGPSGSINGYAGSSGVRAADTVGELIGPIADRIQRASSDAGVIEAVSSNPLAIGVVSYPAPTGVRTLPIGEQGATSFAPSPDSINTQSYPLTRRLYFYADPTPANPNTRKFLEFVQRREGQAIVGKTGYGSQNIALITAPKVRADASSEYRELVANARQLNIALRFRTGRSELDNKALEDLERLIGFLSLAGDGGQGGLMLIGFADAQGDEMANKDLSHQRAEAVAAAMRSRSIQPVSVKSFGEEQPVGDNSTVAGREKNRRVEVWLLPSRGS